MRVGCGKRCSPRLLRREGAMSSSPVTVKGGSLNFEKESSSLDGGLGSDLCVDQDSVAKEASFEFPRVDDGLPVEERGGSLNLEEESSFFDGGSGSAHRMDLDTVGKVVSFEFPRIDDGRPVEEGIIGCQVPILENLELNFESDFNRRRDLAEDKDMTMDDLREDSVAPPFADNLKFKLSSNPLFKHKDADDNLVNQIEENNADRIDRRLLDKGKAVETNPVASAGNVKFSTVVQDPSSVLGVRPAGLQDKAGPSGLRVGNDRHRQSDYKAAVLAGLHGVGHPSTSFPLKQQDHVRLVHSEDLSTFFKNGLVVMDDDRARGNLDKLDKVIVGCLLGRRLPFWLIRQDISKRWGNLGLQRVTPLGEDRFACWFESVAAKENVLHGGPCLVAGHIISMANWTDGIGVGLKAAPSPVWLRLPGLPLCYWDDLNLSRIAASIGRPLFMDALTNNWERCSYARICVKMDLSKRLPKGIWIQGLDGKFFQHIEYEDLPSLCKKCGVVGHRLDNCSGDIVKFGLAVLARSNKEGLLVNTGVCELKDPPLANSGTQPTCLEPSDRGVFSEQGEWTVVSRRRPRTSKQVQVLKGAVQRRVWKEIARAKPLDVIGMEVVQPAGNSVKQVGSVGKLVHLEVESSPKVYKGDFLLPQRSSLNEHNRELNEPLGDSCKSIDAGLVGAALINSKFPSMMSEEVAETSELLRVDPPQIHKIGVMLHSPLKEQKGEVNVEQFVEKVGCEPSKESDIFKLKPRDVNQIVARKQLDASINCKSKMQTCVNKRKSPLAAKFLSVTSTKEFGSCSKDRRNWDKRSLTIRSVAKVLEDLGPVREVPNKSSKIAARVLGGTSLAYSTDQNEDSFTIGGDASPLAT